MDNLLDQNSSLYRFAAEYYEIAKTVEVVVSIAGETKTIRIEVRQAHDHFCTASYIQFPMVDGGYVWASYDLPWTHRPDADSALRQALSFLEERCAQRASR